MAQHKSADKRNRQSEKRRARNQALRSRVRNALKDARTAIEEKSANKSAAVAEAIKVVQHMASKHVVKKETASRAVSRLMKAASAG